MTITFYSIGEKRNKLSKTLGTGTQLTGTMREPSSLIDPVILVESATVPRWNYAYIADFGRYYFITEIVAEQYKIFRIAMHVDVLMSYKGVKNGASSTGIYGLKPYVTRWEGADVDLPETRIPVRAVTDVVTSSVTVQPAWEGSSNIFKSTSPLLKKYFMYIKGEGPSSQAPFPLGAYYYDYWGMKCLASQLADKQMDIVGKTVNDFIYKFGVIPFEIDNKLVVSGAETIDLPGSLNQINLPVSYDSHTTEWWVPTLASYNIRSFEWTLSLSVPSLTNTARNFAPYHKLSLRFRPFGKFELDSGIVFNNAYSSPITFKVRVDVDPITGNAALFYGRSSADVYLGSSNVMMTFPVSGESYSAAKIASGVISVAGAIASAVATEGATAPAAFGAAINAASSLVPNVSVTGGEQFIIDEYPVVESYRKTSIDYAYDYLGKPYYAEDYVYNLSGYIEAGRVNIEGTGFASMLDSERSELERIMMGGCYV